MLFKTFLDREFEAKYLNELRYSLSSINRAIPDIYEFLYYQFAKLNLQPVPKRTFVTHRIGWGSRLDYVVGCFPRLIRAYVMNNVEMDLTLVTRVAFRSDIIDQSDLFAQLSPLKALTKLELVDYEVDRSVRFCRDSESCRNRPRKYNFVDFTV